MENLLELLFEARRLHNKIVRNSNEMDNWHRRVDAVLREAGGEFADPDEECDAPHRVEHRKFVRGLYR